ncbi:hypothetical protein [Halomonas sp. GFAJ-1]|uniref:hypothetical protein n=1 Tax=Halomonas sp. GFAJ-1 TaxID=1118153 RepID=UPI00023A248A|nr:hypothetical protein [Halomonas sp. GFAJ-1]AVI62966.1 hypothetical protein BB497_09815 [Halomonas sp. GFAJ-1]EHK62234.1 hypothetical protein MOY_02319 [Halomonas sp. GFAJ-1]
MKTSFAYISITQSTPVELVPLKIANQGISFFIPSVESYSQFACNTHDVKDWKLSFFQLSANVCVRVLFTPFPLPHNDAVHCQALARVGWWERPLGNSTNTTDRYAVSHFLRGSKALPDSTFVSVGEHFQIACDRNGLALVGTTYQQFQRIVICQALAAAYHYIMTSKMLALTQHLKHQRFDALATLHEEVLAFNASDFFARPIDIARQQLNQVWSHLAAHWQLCETNQQLTSQLKDISNLLLTKREQKAQHLRELRYQQGEKEQLRTEAERASKQEAQARRAFRIDITLSLIGLLSVLSIVQITPNDISQFLNAWANLFLTS